MIKAGFSSAVITPEEPEKVFLGGYAARTHNAVGKHDDLFVKAAYFENNNVRLIWVTLDALAVLQDMYEAIKTAVRKKFGDVGLVVSATHDHSAPETRLWARDMNGAWCSALTGKVLAVAEAAKASKSEVKIYAGTTHVPSVAKNRRGEETVDDELFAMRFEDAKTSGTKGVIINYACHCTVLDSNNYLVSADYPGYLRPMVEKQYNTDFVMFSNAACGNINIGYSADASALGIDMGDVRSFANAKRKAGDLAEGVKEILQNAALLSDELAYRSFTYTMPLKTSLPGAEELAAQIAALDQRIAESKTEDEKTRLGIERVYLDSIRENIVEYITKGANCLTADGTVFRIGNIGFITVPVELFCELGLQLKDAVKDFCHLVILGYSNGYTGYLPTEKAFRIGGYECETSIHNEKGGEVFLKTAEEQLKQLFSETKSFQKDKLNVRVYPTRAEMGLASASDGAKLIKDLLKKQDTINVMFAAAPSQNEFLEQLQNDPEIDWTRINAFHMDEYIGLDPAHPAGFRNFLKTRIFEKVPFRSVNYLNGNAQDPEAEALRYSSLLHEYPIDICFCGIGENGHLAFNDPPVANFRDKTFAKIVKLDETCRMQQVHDGCFGKIDEVPTHALSVTIPGMVAAKHILCIVPAKTKADAVFHTLNDEIKEACPATVLRTHPDAALYLDRDSAAKIL